MAIRAVTTDSTRAPEAISSFQADGSGNATASWRLPHSAARAEEEDEVKRRELLNSMESMQLMLQKAQEDEETARLHAQGLADRLSQGHAELAGETAARLALENEILDMKKQASAEVEAAQSRAEAAESDQETAKSALSAFIRNADANQHVDKQFPLLVAGGGPLPRMRSSIRPEHCDL